jgi:aminotransferase
LGYACGPAELIEAMMKIHQYTMLCASSLAQKAAIEALVRPDVDVGEMVAEYRRRRNFVASAFAEMGLECHRPLGAFYAFPSVAKFKLPAKEFALHLLHEEKVAVVPGTAFGDCGEGFVRCAYATSLDNIKEAMVRMKRFIGKL